MPRHQSPAPASAPQGGTPEISQRDQDRDLVQRMLAGDEDAFNEFAETNFRALYRYALSQLRGDAELSLDVVQTTLCKAIQKIDGFRADASLFTWLRACCRNEILMHYRKQRATPQHVDLDALDHGAQVDPGSRLQNESPSPDADLMSSETTAAVHVTLDLLPPKYARALEMKYLEKHSVKTIAEHLKMTAKATESLLTRARGAFKARFTEHQTTSPGLGEHAALRPPS